MHWNPNGREASSLSRVRSKPSVERGWYANRRLGRPAWDRNKTTTQKRRVKMTKFKKITGIALAGCMALSSLMMTAGAVDMSISPVAEANMRSTFSGETMTCQVVCVDPDGSATDKLLKVNIPQGATVAEEQAMISDAIDAEYGLRSSDVQIGSTNRNAYIPKETSSEGAPVFDEFTLSSTCHGLKVYFYHVSSSIGNLNVRIRNRSMPSSGDSYDVYYLDQEIGNNMNADCTVVFWNGVDVGSQGSGVPALNKGSKITVYASGTKGSGTAYVSVYMVNPWND